jgi:hypothetical protein
MAVSAALSVHKLCMLFFTIMTAISIAPPTNLQAQSPLVALPAEIKHQIFRHCFVAEYIIEDPASHAQVQSKAISTLGVALLQTCRRLYHEVDRRPLFSQNTFRFTTVDKAKAFLKTLDDHHRLSVHNVEIDIRLVSTDRAAYEWVRYLTWPNDPQDTIPGTLRMDAPKLKALRLNFESWPRSPLYRPELWKLLRQMLSNVQGLQRVVVVGASKGQSMARRNPWSPAHYVGSEDVDYNDLVPRMWRTVDGAIDAKVIRWVRKDGKLFLEVVSKAHLLKEVDGDWCGLSDRKAGDQLWPVNGCSSWQQYEASDPNAKDTMMKDFNPNAVV